MWGETMDTSNPLKGKDSKLVSFGEIEKLLPNFEEEPLFTEKIEISGEILVKIGEIKRKFNIIIKETDGSS